MKYDMNHDKRKTISSIKPTFLAFKDFKERIR